ncbi:MAG TPA: DUF1566 domain-containing protein [Polyangiaceae bacterium]|nr:DUF1566 domain-containing protein [Polyangiaceae bacterium]
MHTIRAIGLALAALAMGCGNASSGASDGDAGGGTANTGTGGGGDGASVLPGSASGGAPSDDGTDAASTPDASPTAADGAAGAMTLDAAAYPPAAGPDGGAACPSLGDAVVDAYPRWPMPNPPAANLPNAFHDTDLGNGTVRDEITQLVWQKTVDASQAFTWSAAATYCASLKLPAPAGSAWHVPSRIQILSLVDFTTLAAMDAPFLASGQPPGGKYTWTSTPWVVSQIATKPQYAWMVNFGGGGGLTSNAASQTAAEYVRCVASPPLAPVPYPHYAAVAPGEVEDVLTGLVWSQSSALTLMSPSDATAACASLKLNGHTWRLPSVNELASLVDDNPPIARVSPAIDTCVFPDTPADGYYMSSSSVGSKPWALNYQDGYDSDSEATGYVRCVR